MIVIGIAALFLGTLEHLKSLLEFPPSQGADTLSLKKALDEVTKKLEAPKGEH